MPNDKCKLYGFFFSAVDTIEVVFPLNILFFLSKVCYHCLLLSIQLVCFFVSIFAIPKNVYNSLISFQFCLFLVLLYTFFSYYTLASFLFLCENSFFSFVLEFSIFELALSLSSIAFLQLALNCLDTFFLVLCLSLLF